MTDSRNAKAAPVPSITDLADRLAESWHRWNEAAGDPCCDAIDSIPRQIVETEPRNLGEALIRVAMVESALADLKKEFTKIFALNKSAVRDVLALAQAEGINLHPVTGFYFQQTTVKSEASHG